MEASHVRGNWNCKKKKKSLFEFISEESLELNAQLCKFDFDRLSASRCNLMFDVGRCGEWSCSELGLRDRTQNCSCGFANTDVVLDHPFEMLNGPVWIRTGPTKLIIGLGRSPQTGT